METKKLLTILLILSLTINIVLSVFLLSFTQSPAPASSPLVKEKPIDLNEEELSSLALACQSQGEWLEEYQECQWSDLDWCREQGGQFEECTSACRHLDQELAQFCTTECVPVCRF